MYWQNETCTGFSVHEWPVHVSEDILDCFNKDLCDIVTISELLPAVIILTEKDLIVNKKIDAAAKAFAATWIEPTWTADKDIVKDDDDVISEDSYYNIGIEQGGRWTDNTGCSNAELKSLQKSITRCLPLTLGFHPGNGAKDWCYCPCSKTMKGWRDKYEFIGPEEPCTKGDMTASALIQHVDSKK